MDKLYYDTCEISAMFGISEAYLRKLRSRQAGPVFVRVGGRMIRYRVADVERWLDVNAVEVTPKRAS